MLSPTEAEPRATHAGPRKGGWFRRLKLIVVLVVAVLVLIFFFQNKQNATVEVLFWSLEVPVSLLLLGAFVAGAAIGWIALHLVGRQRD